jgi:hypothetical protein
VAGIAVPRFGNSHRRAAKRNSSFRSKQARYLKQERSGKNADPELLRVRPVHRVGGQLGSGPELAKVVDQALMNINYVESTGKLEKCKRVGATLRPSASIGFALRLPPRGVHAG